MNNVTIYAVKIPDSETGEFYTKILYVSEDKSISPHVLFVLYTGSYELYRKLPDDCKVFSLRGSYEGVETIGDIRNHFKEKLKKYELVPFNQHPPEIRKYILELSRKACIKRYKPRN